MKNFKGGYKIISLEGNDLSSSFSITGIYNALTETYQKTILVTGIVISGEKKNDAYTEVNIVSDDYKFTIYGYEVTIADDDSVEAEQVTLDAVTSIGGVNGEITLGNGLSITEEGVLSTVTGVTHYMHYYKNPTSSMGSMYIECDTPNLAENINEFCNLLLHCYSFQYFENSVLKIGLGVLNTSSTITTTSVTVIGATNDVTPSISKKDISSCLTRAAQTHNGPK